MTEQYAKNAVKIKRNRVFWVGSFPDYLGSFSALFGNFRAVPFLDTSLPLCSRLFEPFLNVV